MAEDHVYCRHCGRKVSAGEPEDPPASRPTGEHELSGETALAVLGPPRSRNSFESSAVSFLQRRMFSFLGVAVAAFGLLVIGGPFVTVLGSILTLLGWAKDEEDAANSTVISAAIAGVSVLLLLAST